MDQMPTVPPDRHSTTLYQFARRRARPAVDHFGAFDELSGLTTRTIGREFARHWLAAVLANPSDLECRHLLDVVGFLWCQREAGREPVR